MSSSPASTAVTGDSKTQVGAIVGIALVGFFALLWYFGFVLILWLMLAIVVTAGIACAVGATGVKDKDSRNGLLFGAALCGLVSFGLWKWIDSKSIVIPSLPRVADAQLITSEYKDRVTHIQMGYEATESRLLWQETVTGGGSGSGILLANNRTRGIILTNRHVIDPTYTGDASNVNQLALGAKLASENEWHPAKVAAIHRSLDMALVIVDKPFRYRGAVKVANHRLLQQGEGVVALGNPLGIEFVTTEGIVSQMFDDAVVTSCPISPGNSGGPLILKRRGLVAGINTLSALEGQNVNLAVPAQWALLGYPPQPEAPKKKVYLHPFIRAAGDIVKSVSSSSRVDAGSWTWISDQESVLKLLEMVPIEEAD